jgi:hypothetical protein
MRCSRRRWSDSALARGVALAALITGFVVPVAAAQQAVPGVLTGVVVDSTGTPLDGAIVHLPAVRARTHSNAVGQFVLDRVPPGRYEIVSLLIGFLAEQDSVNVRAGETTHVRIRLAVPPLHVDTLPPRLMPGTRSDSAPAESETIDRVARVARLPRLRPEPVDRKQREVRIWVGGGISIPMLLLRITDDGRRVRGEEVLWLEQVIPDRGVDARWRAFMDSVPSWLRRDFHCGAVATDTLYNPVALAGFERTLIAACRVRFAREPDWRAVLADLERHHVFTLPDASELPVVVTRRSVNEEVITTDGGGATVEAWNGTRYRAYTIGNPDLQPFPEYRDAWAIIRLVFRYATSHSSDARQ